MATFFDERANLFDKYSLKQIFIISDPRDAVVSMAYFIPNQPVHDLYKLFSVPCYDTLETDTDAN